MTKHPETTIAHVKAGQSPRKVAKGFGYTYNEAEDAVVLPGFVAADESGVEVEFPGAKTAEEAANEYISEGYDREDKTYWVSVSVWQRAVDANGEVFTIDAGDFTPEVEPEVPGCTENEHEWEQTHVRGNAGGVIVTEWCKHCGCIKVTDTWARHGAQEGFTSVEYREAEYPEDEYY